MQRVEEPERRVGGVVEALTASFREHVRDQPVAYVMGEGAQDPPRLDRPPGRERQPFERDHRVAAPIGEPVIAGNDGADFIAFCARPRDIGDAPHRGDEKIVGREDELGSKPGPHHRRGQADETAAALAFEGQRVAGAQRRDGMPWLRRRDKGQRAIGADLSDKIAGAPQPASGLIPPLRLDLEEALPPRAAIGDERGALAALDGQTQRRQVGPGSDLVSLSSRGERVAGGQGLADRRLDRVKVDEGSETQACSLSVAMQPKSHVNDVVAGRQNNRLLDYHAVDLVAPARQAHFQGEIDKASLLAKIGDGAVGTLDLDIEIVQYHHAAERGWQRRDQEAVVRPSDRPGYRRRGIAAEPIRHQPFARHLGRWILIAADANYLTHSRRHHQGRE